MEELLLSCLLFGNKLDIVHQKEVGAAVFFMKSMGVVISDVIDKLVCKMLAACIDYVCVRSVLFHLIHNCAQQMRFTKSAVTVNEKRVIRLSG